MVANAARWLAGAVVVMWLVPDIAGAEWRSYRNRLTVKDSFPNGAFGDLRTSWNPGTTNNSLPFVVSLE